MNRTPQKQLTTGAKSVAKSAMTLLILALGSAYAFFHLFSRFSAYDDEGLVLYAIKNFLAGNALYDVCMTQYGPGFFLVHSIIFDVLKVPVTHDGMRVVSLMFWLMGSALTGLVVARITSCIKAGWVSFFSSIVLASAIANEPGHPQAMLHALIALGTLVAVSRHTTFTILILGAIAGLTGATKINIGVFFGTAVVWTFLSLGRQHKITTYLWWCCAIGLLALPVVLMKDLIHIEHVRQYAIIAVVAMANLLIVSWFSAKNSESSKPALQFIIAAVVAFLLCGSFAIANGTSIAGLTHGIIWQHVGFAEEFFVLPPNISQNRLIVIVLSLPSLVLYRFVVNQPKWKTSAKWIAAVAQIVLGVVVSFGTLWQWRQTALLLPWMWLAVTETASDSDSSQKVHQRLLLFGLACLLFLQAYPVAGSQWWFATAPLLPLCWICITNGLHGIRSLTNSTVVVRMCRAVPTLLLLVSGVFFLAMACLKFRINDQGVTPISLRGTNLLRLPEAELAVLETVNLNIEHNSQHVLTMPGMYSFCLWSGVDSPTLRNQGNWPIMMSESEQQTLVERIETSQRILAVKNNEVFRIWNRPGLKKFGPAVEYVNREFQSMGSIGSYEITNRQSEKADSRLVGARWIGGSKKESSNNNLQYAMIQVPPVGGKVRSVRIGSYGAGPSIRTHSVGGQPFMLLDESGNIASRKAEIVLDDWQKFVIAIESNQRASLGNAPFVQLLDEAGNIVLRLSFVSSPKLRRNVSARQ